jgi:hypothetical protein
VLAIENCLLKDLSDIFSPTLTADMDDEQLYAIAAESEDARDERSSLKKKLDTLKSGKQILHEHMGKCIEQSDTKADLIHMTAMRPSIQVKTSTQDVPHIVKTTTPYTPNPRKTDQSNSSVEKARQGAMTDLTAKLNNLIVTPPPSGSNSRASSRQRVDSLFGTPSLNASARKRSPRRWPPQFGVLGPETQDGSEEEL